MANLQIPDHIEEELQFAAESSGRTRDEVAVEILASHFADESLPLSAFSESELSRLKESIEQVKRGEVVTSEVIEQKFEAWFAKRAAR